MARAGHRARRRHPRHSSTPRAGAAPGRMYVAGISNGGYLARWQLENRPDLYDGGLDWEGSLFRADGPNLLTYLPTALKNYPAYAATGDAGRARRDGGGRLRAGLGVPVAVPPPGVLGRHPARCTARSSTRGSTGHPKAGTPFCARGAPNCDADYVYASRPPEVPAVPSHAIALTGHGRQAADHPSTATSTRCCPSQDSDVYDQMVTRRAAAGCTATTGSRAAPTPTACTSRVPRPAAAAAAVRP